MKGKTKKKRRRRKKKKKEETSRTFENLKTLKPLRQITRKLEYQIN